MDICVGSIKVMDMVVYICSSVHGKFLLDMYFQEKNCSIMECAYFQFY